MTGMDDASFWLDLIYKVGTVGVLLWLAIAQRAAANKAEIDRVERTTGTAITGLENRVTHLEARAESGPTHDDLQKIHDRISKGNDLTSSLRADVSRLNEGMDNVKRALDLLNRTHMKGGEE